MFTQHIEKLILDKIQFYKIDSLFQLLYKKPFPPLCLIKVSRPCPAGHYKRPLGEVFLVSVFHSRAPS